MHRSFTMETRQRPSPSNEAMILFFNAFNQSYPAAEISWHSQAGDAPGFAVFDPSVRANNQVAKANIIPIPGTLEKFFILGALPSGGQSVTLKIMKNGTATGLTVTLTSASNDGFGNAQGNDIAHSASVVTNDLISLEIDNTANGSQWTGSAAVVLIPS